MQELQTLLRQNITAPHPQAADGSPRAARFAPVADSNTRQRIITAKSTPYIPLTSPRALPLNGQVTVQTPDTFERAGNNSSVFCRHLAMRFIQEQGKKRELMPTFASKQSVAAEFEGKLGEKSEAVERASTEAPPESKHLFHKEDFGRYLSSVATALSQKAGGSTERSGAHSLVMTTGHVMATHVERKHKDGVTYFTAKFYEPNVTNNYARVEAHEPKDFEKLGLSKFIVYDNVVAGDAVVANCTDHDLKLEFTADKPIALAPGNMALAMRQNMPKVMKNLADAAKAQAIHSKDALFDLLEGKESAELARPLLQAMSNGNTGAISAFGQEVKNSGLSEDQQCELLSVDMSSGGIVLNALIASASRSPHTVAHGVNAMKAYVAVIDSSGLSDSHKLRLLTRPNEREGLSIHPVELAIGNGNLDWAKEFCREVLKSNLNDDDKVKILKMPINENGHSALTNPDASPAQREAADAYIAAVKASDLPQRQKANLLGHEPGN